MVNDPQLGPSNSLLAFDYYPVHSKEFTQEARLYSSFAGPWNFNFGLFPHRDTLKAMERFAKEIMPHF